MCGLFGAAWATTRPKTKECIQRGVILTVLAQHMERRGGQSWGIHDVTGRTVTRRIGSIGDASLVDWAQSRTVYGHTRYATKGRVSVENAHPFTIGRIVGAHNGVLYNHEKLNEKHGRKHTVDSRHIFSHLHERKPLDDIDGYGTVLWTDTDRAGGTLVSLGVFNGGDVSVWRMPLGVVWASTDAAVKAALSAGGFDWRDDGCSPYKIEERNRYELRHDGVVLADVDVFTCGRSSLTSWRGLGQRERDGSEWYSRLLERDADAAVIDEQRTDAIATRQWDRSQIRILGHKRGLPQSHLERVWELDFDPTDMDDRFYRVGGRYDEGLYTEVAMMIDWEVWPCPAYGRSRESDTWGDR